VVDQTRLQKRPRHLRSLELGRISGQISVTQHHSIQIISSLPATTIMDSSSQLKTTFEPETVIQPIFTRGNVALTRDGRILASCVEEDTVLTDLQTGVQLAKIEGVGSGNPQMLELANRSRMARL
jgi:hypothetical protein